MDSTVIAVQKDIILSITRSFFSYFMMFMIAVVGAIVSAAIIQMVISRKNARQLLANLKQQIGSKVGLTKFDDSIRRTHDQREQGDNAIHKRIDVHVEQNNKEYSEIKSGLQWIQGYLEKKGKTDAST